MKTTKRYISKLIVAKTTTIPVAPGIDPIVYRKGRVIETRISKDSHYYLNDRPYVIVLGHGMNEVIPVENLKVTWSEETTKTVVTTKNVKVTARK
jgi:uroporphyrinogen-III decarboxylase